MLSPAYGELYDHEFKQLAGDYELWIAKVRYPNRPAQHGYNLRARRGGSMSNDAPFNTEEEAIARGLLKACQLTTENTRRLEEFLAEQRRLGGDRA